MVAGRRYMAEEMAKYKPVYSYRFNQPPDNVTIDVGVSVVLTRTTILADSSPRSFYRRRTTLRWHLSSAYVPRGATHVPDKY